MHEQRRMRSMARSRRWSDLRHDPDKITSWDIRKLPDSAQRYAAADR